jgi:hypothetical protein
VSKKKKKGKDEPAPGPRLALETEVREASFDELDTLNVDALVLFLSEDQRPLQGLLALVDWRLCGRLSRMCLKETVTGSVGEHTLIPTGGRIRAEKLFVIGAGPSASVEDRAKDLIDEAIVVLKDAQVGTVAIGLPHRAALGYVDEHARKPLQDRLSAVLAMPGEV